MSASHAAQKINPLAVGDQAPDFNLETDGGGRVQLSELKGRKIVIYFYPKDDTPGCTIEAKDFRDHKAAFDKANVVIIGVSRDSVKSHDKFKEKYCLPFSLAADESGEMCEAYGVWVEKSMYGKKYMGVERATFLIDASGKIAHIWPKVKVDGHVREVLEAAEKL